VAVLNNSAGESLGEEEDELEDLLGAELEGAPAQAPAPRDASTTPQPRQGAKKASRQLPALLCLSGPAFTQLLPCCCVCHWSLVAVVFGCVEKVFQHWQGEPERLLSGHVRTGGQSSSYAPAPCPAQGSQRTTSTHQHWSSQVG
jgi:hypothetical protein